MSMTMRNYIYIKKCLGKNREPLKIYKFRTMDFNADERLDESVKEIFDSLGKPIEDLRITGIGKFLRRYWIDELPQIYNLTRGDIKLVGVRPMQEIEWKRYPEDIMERSFRQKPGLMGVQYAFPKTGNFDNHLAHLRENLDMWEENPAKTDRDYLSRIVRNIVFGGIRSS